jgi:hypothetical protein
MLTNLQAGIMAGLTLLIGALTGFFGAYIKAYGGKRGELQAMHEGIEKLVEQVNIVEKRQEEIKAEVLGAVWQRQTSWTLKKEILFEALRAVGVLQAAALELIGITTSIGRQQREHSDYIPGKEIGEMKSKAQTLFTDAFLKVNAIRMLAGVVANKDVQDGLHFVKEELGNLTLRCLSGCGEPTEKELSSANQCIVRVIEAIKNDLELSRPVQQ